MDPSEYAPITELLLVDAGTKTAPQHQPLVFQTGNGGLDVGPGQVEQRGHFGDGEGTGGLCPPAHGVQHGCFAISFIPAASAGRRHQADLPFQRGVRVDGNCEIAVFGGQPEGRSIGLDDAQRPTRLGQVLQPSPEHLSGSHLGARRQLVLWYDAQRQQGVVQFVGIADGGPGEGRLVPDGVRIQRGQVAGILGQSAAQGDGPGSPLLQRRIVQEGIGHGVENLVGKHRRLHRVLGEHLYRAGSDGLQDALQSFEVHGLGETIAGGLENQRMVRRLDVPRLRVVLALNLGGEHGGQQVIGTHPLERRRHLLAPGVPQQSQKTGSVPTPPGAVQGGLEHRLGQHLVHRVGRKVVEHVAQGEGHAGTQRKVQPVVGGRGLELEIKGPADPLAQRHAPGPVDGRAEGSVDDQLHPAALVKKPLGDHLVSGGHHAQDSLPFDEIGDQLPGHLRRHAGFGQQPSFGVRRIIEKPVNAVPELRDLVGEFPGAARGFAQPEGDGGQIAVGIFDPHAPAFHAADFPGSVAQQEDVAGHALDGEVLVDGAHESSVRVGHHVVIGVVGNGPAAGQGGNARPPASLQPMIDAIPVQVCAVPTQAWGKSL